MQMPPTDPAGREPVQRLAILFSGRGSNMQAIAEAARTEHWPAVIVAVIAHRDDIAGIRAARGLGLPVRILPLSPDLTRADHDRALAVCLDELACDWIVLAGYLRILSTDFVQRFAGRLVNIHPSLLPAFAGLRTHRQALAAGVKVHGATVHLVTEALDSGPILAQAVVPVMPDDDEERLAERVLRVEHRLYPVVLRGLLEGRIAIDGCRSRWRDAPVGHDPLLMLMPEAA